MQQEKLENLQKASTKAGIISGIKSGYKKALVTVAEGETIDLYATL